MSAAERLSNTTPNTGDFSTLARLVSIDGNNSLKRWDKSHYGIVPLEDSRHARSDLWLSEHDVDHFQYEVKSNTVRIVLLFRPCCNM